MELTWRQVPEEVARLIQAGREKAASIPLHDIVSLPAQAFGMTEGPLNSWHGGPRPLASLLAGSALGGLAGYGGGWLAEHLLPEHLQRKRLRKTLATVGATLGAIPGVWQGYDNVRLDGSVLDRFPYEKQSSLIDEALDTVNRIKVDTKSADWPSSMSPDFMPVVNRNAVGEVVWGDPYMPEPIAAGTTGLLEAAAQTRDGSNWVSPFDVARIAVGMGSGYASGLVVGKVLGAVSGLSDPAQKALQRGGTLAGLLTTIVPTALGR